MIRTVDRSYPPFGRYKTSQILLLTKLHVVTLDHHSDLPIPELSALGRSEKNVVSFNLLFNYYME